MDTLQAIRTRRSIRSYRNEPVSEEAIRTLLEAAMVAPSAMDERPWHFVVIEGREPLDALADGLEHCDMLREATAAILVCGDLRLEQLPGFWVQDCSAATQNLLLAAHALGLGAVWIGIHPFAPREEALRTALGLPDPVIPLALVSLGHPGEELPGEDRFDPGRIHRNRWSPAE